MYTSYFKYIVTLILVLSNSNTHNETLSFTHIFQKSIVTLVLGFMSRMLSHACLMVQQFSFIRRCSLFGYFR